MTISRKLRGGLLLGLVFCLMLHGAMMPGDEEHRTIPQPPFEEVDEDNLRITDNDIPDPNERDFACKIRGKGC